MGHDRTEPDAGSVRTLSDVKNLRHLAVFPSFQSENKQSRVANTTYELDFMVVFCTFVMWTAIVVVCELCIYAKAKMIIGCWGLIL